MTKLVPVSARRNSGRRDGRAEVWARPLADGSVAVALLNRGDAPTPIATTTSDVDLQGAAAYRVSDVWAGTSTTTASPDLAATVPAHGVAFYRVTPVR